MRPTSVAKETRHLTVKLPPQPPMKALKSHDFDQEGGLDLRSTGATPTVPRRDAFYSVLPTQSDPPAVVQP